MKRRNWAVARPRVIAGVPLNDSFVEEQNSLFFVIELKASQRNALIVFRCKQIAEVEKLSM